MKIKGESIMRKRNHVILFALASAVMLGCVPAYAEETGETKEIQILSTSDLHGKFAPYDYAVNEESTSGSMAQIQTILNEIRTDNTILVDVGNTIQGNSSDLFLEDEVHPMIQAMNYMKYDAWVLGNHEFNYGVDTLKHVMKGAQMPVLNGNVYDEEGKLLTGTSYTIVEKDGVKIALIGMVTPNITRWDSANLEGYKVTDPVEETKKIIEEIGDQADIIVAAEHMGESNEYEVDNSGVVDLANACPELDVILAAHEHKLVEGTEVNGVLIVENLDAGKTLAQVKLTVEEQEDGSFEVADKTSAIYAVEDYEADKGFMEALADADTCAKEDANTVIGTLTGGPLAPESEINGIAQAKLQESALIDLINEVQMYYTGADVSAVALFNDATNMQNGDIRKCDLSLIYKYANTLYKMEMTGAQLKKYMEWSASYYNTFKDGDLTISFNEEIPGFNYDIFSGVNYEIDISKEPGERIQNLTRPDGTEIAENDILSVAVNNYRAASQLTTYGEIYKEGEELPKILEIDVRGDIGGVRELIGDYIMNVKGGALEAPKLTGNWKLTGYNWDEELHEKAVQLINEGKLELPTDESGRNKNVRSITEADLEGIE